MPSARVLVTTAGWIAAAMAIQGFLFFLWDFAVDLIEFPRSDLRDLWASTFSGNEIVVYLAGLLHIAAFGFGIYLVLRNLAPITATTPWGQTIIRAIYSALGGMVVAFACASVVSVIAAVTIGAYPLGYSFSAGVDPSRLEFDFQDALQGILPTLLNGLPFALLGGTFLRLWLVAHPEAHVVDDDAEPEAEPETPSEQVAATP